MDDDDNNGDDNQDYTRLYQIDALRVHDKREIDILWDLLTQYFTASFCF